MREILRPVEEINKLLSEKRKIMITTHNNPDGDAIGSSLAMYHYLKIKGHEVDVVIPNMFPEFLAWIPGSKEMLVYDRQSALVKKVLTEAEVVFCLDYNAIKGWAALLISSRALRVKEY